MDSTPNASDMERIAATGTELALPRTVGPAAGSSQAFRELLLETFREIGKTLDTGPRLLRWVAKGLAHAEATVEFSVRLSHQGRALRVSRISPVRLRVQWNGIESE